MAYIMNIPVSDQQARDYYASDINKRISILQFTGLGGYVDAAVSEWLQEAFGYLGGIIFSDPQIHNLLMQAGKEGWSEAKVQGALTKTNYWRNTDAPTRQWNQLGQSDPQTQKKLYNDALGQVQAQAQLIMGHALNNDAALKGLVTKVASGSITDEAVIRRLIVAQAQYNPAAPASLLTSQQSEIVGRSQQFGLKMTDQAAFEWAKRVAAGTADPTVVDEFIRDKARAVYGGNEMVKQALDAGLTVREAVDSQIARLAELTGLDAETINLTDERWAPIVQYTDPDSGVFRPMTMTEVGVFGRSQNEWAVGEQGKGAAAGFGEKLLNTFGKVASA